LVDDEDLAGVIWTQGFKVDLPIVVDTCEYRSAIFLRINYYRCDITLTKINLDVL
jgi:hypothetical protein